MSEPFDVAVIGAGYVGIPLAATFAEAGCSVLVVDVVPELVEGLNRGESHIEDVSSERLAPLVASGKLRATTDYARGRRVRRDRDRGADAALEPARARPLHRRERGAQPRAGAARRASSSCSSRRRGPARRARSLQPILETSGLLAGEDFHLAFAPERVDPGRTDWTTKTTPKVVGGLTPACTERAAGALRPRDRHRPPRLDARGGRADEAAREHLPLGQHRARQRARAPLRPDGHRRLGGRRRRRDEAVRLHAASSPARASAATASRSTRSTSRGRRASTASTRGSSSWPARSTTRCRTSAARSSPRRSTMARRRR